MKSPAFQFYPKDWLSSRGVRMMTDQQRGWYIQLLCEAWESEIQGTLPNDPTILWRLAGADNEQVFNACSTPVLSMFEARGTTLIHHRLAEEIAKQQQWSEHCANAGRKSGQVRRKAIKDQHLAQVNTCSTPVHPRLNRPVEPKANIASASASASTTSPPGAEVAMATLQKPAKTIRAIPPQRHELAKRWQAGFKACFGSPYLEAKGKDDAGFDKLLSVFSADDIMAVAEKAWRLNGKHEFEHKQSLSVASFASQFQKLQAVTGLLKSKSQSKIWTGSEPPHE